MSDQLAVSANETGLYRIFSIDLPPAQIEAFTTPEPNAIGDDDYPLRDALGLSYLDEQHVQILDQTELKTIGIETYITDGLGVPKDVYADALPRLNSLEGHIAVIASAAFEGPDIIVPSAPVTFVTALREDKPQTAFIDLSTTSAQGVIDARVSGKTDPPPRMPLTSLLVILIGLVVVGYGVYVLLASLGGTS
ncbi:hypothetical protein [Cognatishimia sp. MH4019]|uniref:hypothetical protein n=1 Tax=Cognatishimia sp. MH4019 TaxID=2854030 RepID=UPI001CD6B99F|nr:hypothetical protein [Cognatishimia sp. MH4019]